MPQKASELRLIPYVEINGARTLPDSFVEDVFTEMVVRGLVSTVFAGSLVKDGDDFLRMIRSPSNLAVFAVLGEQCVGLAWLNGIGVNHAYGHFCYFDNDHVSAVEFGRKVLDYWWSLSGPKGAVLDVILGAIPSFNARAVAYVQKMGFVKLGEIPNLFLNPSTGEKWASVVLYCTRP
jgi:hypothetical protein